MLNANKIPRTGGDSENKMTAPTLEPGGYPGRLVQIISLGLQKRDPYKGEEKAPAYFIRCTYELSDEFMLDEEGNEIKDKPRFISEDFPFFSLDVDAAKSTERYKALDPNIEHGGDWAKLIGSAAIINIINRAGNGKHAGRVFENIKSVSSMRKKEADALPELINPPLVLDLDDGSDASVEAFKSLPAFVTDRIKSGLEWETTNLAASLGQGTPPEPKTTDAGEAEDEVVW